MSNVIKKLRMQVKKYIVYRNRDIQNKMDQLKKQGQTAVKGRSRGAAEQRAMFAKMGASGSLQAKGPGGKRTGPKEKPKNSDKSDIQEIANLSSSLSGLRERLVSKGFRLSGTVRARGFRGKLGDKDSIYTGPGGDKFIIRISSRDRGPGLDFHIESTKQHTPPPPSFTVYKDTRGRARWVSISSNGFRDKDREIVSTSALKSAVARADKLYHQYRANGDSESAANLKARGPLRWWHVKGLDMGVCDFQAINGRLLIESGTFNNERIAEKMAKAKDLNVSIGFKHPLTEPDKKGIFNSIVIFERSPTPAGRAANNYTGFTTVKGEQKTMNKAKLSALRELLGDNLLNETLESAQLTEKAAATEIGEIYGETFKDDNANESPTIAQLMELWEAYKEAEAEIDDDWSDDETADDWSDDETTKADDSMAMIKSQLDRIEAKLNKMTGTEETKKDDTIAQLEAEIAALKSDAPRAANGYRASLQNQPIDDDAPNGKAELQNRQKEAATMGPAGQLYTAAADLTAGLFDNL